jgi:hypothetical protein
MASSFSRISRWSIVTLVVLSAIVWPEHSHGVTKGGASSPADLVKEALHREIYGLGSERQQLLTAALRKDANYGPAQWQQGFIQSGGQWVDIERLSCEGEPELMIEYAAHREKCADTVDGQMQLANWCRDKQLPLQERAHLSRVIDLNGEHQAARARLGYRRVSGRWLTEAEVADSLGRQKLEVDAGKRWRPELIEIGRDLQHPTLARREAARGRLAAIKEIHAIPAMESVLSIPNQDGALAVVNTVGEFKGSEAVESLVRHAVFSPWPLVRQAAAERLKERKWVNFVPLMLREMYTPLVSRYGISELPNGRIVYTHAFSREGQDEQQVMQLDTSFSRISRPDGDSEGSLMRVFETSFARVSRREQEAARQNAIQLTYNQRLVEALRIATYQDLPIDPKAWWQWWDDQNDVVRLNGKQTRSQYQMEQLAVVDRRDNRTQLVSATPRGRPVRVDAYGNPIPCECFAAGTIVWTRYGEQKIESIRIGDLVLAQNIETGELAFKPVLGRTVRPPEELVKVSVGKDTFECSRGHLFWVAGHGWAKAERLESGFALHCLRGSTPLSAVDKGLQAETYNLLVADYHNYFVGSERVLSHDVTQMSPTEAIVPGLLDD